MNQHNVLMYTYIPGVLLVTRCGFGGCGLVGALGRETIGFCDGAITSLTLVTVRTIVNNACMSSSERWN